MEADSTSEQLRRVKIDMDKALTGVMPDTWEGHARLAIRQSDHVPEHIESTAVEKACKIADRKNVSTERAANALIKKLAEKRD